MKTRGSRLIELKGSNIHSWIAALNSLPDDIFAKGVWLRAINTQGSDIFFYYNGIGELCESFSYFDITVDYTRGATLRKVEEILFIHPGAELILEDFCEFAAKQIIFCASDGAFGSYYELWWDHTEQYCRLRNPSVCRQLRYELPKEILMDMDIGTFNGILSGAYTPARHVEITLPEELID